MPEAEVTLALAFWLLDHAGSKSHADIAIDGAHVQVVAHSAEGRAVKERSVFPIQDYLQTNGVTKKPERGWRGEYVRRNCTFRIKSVPGYDVQVVVDGKRIAAECKGGPLTRTKGKSERAILEKAIGKLVCSGATPHPDELWAAVPDTRAFESAGRSIAKTGLFVRTGIRIALVSSPTEVRLIETERAKSFNQ
jgi:hypothetical protein